jgi:hypothetical protein
MNITSFMKSNSFNNYMHALVKTYLNKSQIKKWVANRNSDPILIVLAVLDYCMERNYFVM